jgi:hypothetical protein
MLPKQIKALAESLRLELSSIHEEIRSARDASKIENEKDREIVGVIASTIQAVNANVPDYEKTQRDKEYRLQRRLFWATVGAGAAAAIYAAIAADQAHLMNETYGEIQKQTTAAQFTAKAAQQQAALMRQQLVGSEAAFFEFRPNLYDGSDWFWPSAYNLGHSAANSLHIETTFEERNIRGERVVWRSEVFTEDIPVAPPEKHAIPPTRRRVKIDWTSVHALRTYVRATMNYRYDNGFGTVVNGSECWIWVGHDGRSPPSTCSELEFTLETERKNQQNAQQK